MKVAHICSMDFGGAGNAAYRLHKGLMSIGVHSLMIVMYKRSRDESVYEIPSGASISADKRWSRLTSGWEDTLSKYPMRSHENELFSLFTSPIDSSAIERILSDADIINLHWTAGMFDPTSMRKSLYDKKIVWTLHDMNPFTGGCHYAGECLKYRAACGECPQLGSNSDEDMSRSGWLCKSAVYHELDITVVTPSRWLSGCSSSSTLLAKFQHEVIPYGFPLSVYKPLDRHRIRAGFKISPEDKVVMFCADRVSSKRKGFRFFREAMKLISKSGRGNNIVIAVVGSFDYKDSGNCGCRELHFGHIGREDQMAMLYNAADIFVLPSIEDNLPNTVIESLSCGTPVAAFDSGGVPEAVTQGQTGRLALRGDINSLAEAIEWCLHRSPHDIRQLCRDNAQKSFSLQTQARNYIDLYNSISYKRFKDLNISPRESDLMHSDKAPPPQKGFKKEIVSSAMPLDRKGCYLVSAIVSTYNSEKYFGACLELLTQQTLYRRGQMEIVVINSGSQQGEEAIFRRVAARYPHIRYERTGRETLYAAWNRGIALAQGKYVVNANTDDTLRDDALELLTAALELHLSADLAYGDCAWTRVPNDRFDDAHAFRVVDYPPFTPSLGMLCCLLGPHPVWRRSVFDRIGLFNSLYTCAGDYDFQMRFIEAGRSAVHVPEVLSLFFQNPEGLTLSTQRSRHEATEVERKYRSSMPIGKLYSINNDSPTSVAQAWTAHGNLALMWKCPWLEKGPPLPEYAATCYRKALEIDPGSRAALRNLCALEARYGNWDICRLLLAGHEGQDEELRVRIESMIPPDFLHVSVPPAVESKIFSPNRADEGICRNRSIVSSAKRERRSSTHSLHVLYDISVLGLGAIYESARTGIYRVVEHVVQGLASSHGVTLSFCATQAKSERSPETIIGCLKYLAAHPELRDIPFFESRYPPVDIFHSPFHVLPREVDARIRFLTVYDLIPILFPRLIPARVTHLQKRIFAQRRPDDRYFCISHATRNDLIRVVGIAPGQTVVTPLAADSRMFYHCSDAGALSRVRAKYGIGEAAYILSLCTLEPRKNVDQVIRAFARLVRDGRVGDARLVLAGTKGWDYQRIFEEIDGNPALQSRVIPTGYVADEDLAALYSGASVFAYMSLYEGFGLPPLEAMQCGTPVIVSNTSSLPEVVGEAGIQLDPGDLDGLCFALSEIMTDSELRAEMSRRALGQAAKFSWARCVESTVAAYREAVLSSIDTRVRPVAHVA